MIIITHSTGFFSNCSVKLFEIISFLNYHKILPEQIDTTASWHLYRPKDRDDDLFFHYFKIPSENNIEYQGFIENNLSDQFRNYKEINYSKIILFIDKYFRLHDEILDLSNRLKSKYNLERKENFCGVYYRGTDKAQETRVATYAEYFDKMKEIKNLRFVLLSDDEYFLEEAKNLYPDSITFEENEPSSSDMPCHYIFKGDSNYAMAKNFLAMIYLISQFEHIICCNSNGSIWMTYFRGNANNISQYSNGVWV